MMHWRLRTRRNEWQVSRRERTAHSSKLAWQTHASSFIIAESAASRSGGVGANPIDTAYVVENEPHRSAPPDQLPMIATALAFLTLCGITIAAVFAFGWAAKNGQFRDQDAAARVVFDPDEPEGETTDAFPGLHPPAASEEKLTDHR